jgi:hypothetical protein
MNDCERAVAWTLAVGCAIGMSVLCCCYQAEGTDKVVYQHWCDNMYKQNAASSSFYQSCEGAAAHTESEVAAGRVGVGAFEMSRHTDETYRSRNN